MKFITFSPLVKVINVRHIYSGIHFGAFLVKKRRVMLKIKIYTLKVVQLIIDTSMI